MTNALMHSMMESMQQETERVAANGGGSFDQLRVPDAFMMLDEFQRLTELTRKSSIPRYCQGRQAQR